MAFHTLIVALQWLPAWIAGNFSSSCLVDLRENPDTGEGDFADPNGLFATAIFYDFYELDRPPLLALSYQLILSSLLAFKNTKERTVARNNLRWKLLKSIKPSLPQQPSNPSGRDGSLALLPLCLFYNALKALPVRGRFRGVSSLRSL